LEFSNKQFEDAVRELLTASDLEFTEENLKFVTGIHICNEVVRNYYVPWQSTSSAFKMTPVNLFLTWDMVNDGDLALFPHIKALHAYGNAGTPPDERRVPLHLFPDLKEFYLYKATVDNWVYLENMASLKMLYLHKCDGDGNKILKHIAALRLTQKDIFFGVATPTERLMVPVLDHLSIVHMGVSDLSPVDRTWIWDDVDLSYSEISDISPLENNAVYHLNLRWNKISDIKPLESSRNYYLNLRHNQIDDINPLINRVGKKNAEHAHRQLSRLYINYNPIPREQLAKVAKLRLIHNDFTDGNRNIRSDFTYEQESLS